MARPTKTTPPLPIPPLKTALAPPFTTSPDMPNPTPRLLLLIIIITAASGDPPASDKASLLAFLNATPHARRIQWNSSTSPCTWTGVVCDAAATSVVGLHLPGVGLVGPIPPSTLTSLRSLQTLSLRSNRLTGPVPNLSNLTSLRGLHIQDNLFSGEVPPSISLLRSLSVLDLAGNNLSGEIPFSLNNLTKLRLLSLDRNGFSGKLPSLDIPSMTGFNVSHNRLNGSIPTALSRFPASSFAGNLDLCGGPLPPCFPFFPSPAPAPGGELLELPRPSSRRRLSTPAIIAIAVAAGLAILILLAILLFLALRRKRKRKSRRKPLAGLPKEVPAAAAAGAMAATDVATSSTSKDDMTGRDGEKNKLVFFENGTYSFDLEDLLRASAEVLGKGGMGTSYKAVLEDSTTVVVKRLKDVGVQKREFESLMEVLGKVRAHENVVPIRAYYYSKDEKLLVYDYLTAGSLSALLHGGRGSGRPPLDWDSRLRIALAVGSGLYHLHISASLPHGNLKASNILLRPDPDAAALSDYGLISLFVAAPVHHGRVAGYRSPEFIETRRPTFKSDVYSFGVLLLELLTGKAPNQPSLGDEGIDLPRWVQSVVREEWTAEVFDVDLVRLGEGSVEEEMVRLLQIAMSCVALLPDARPEMGDVVRMIDDIARRGEEGEDGRRVSSDDPSKGGSAEPSSAAG